MAKNLLNCLLDGKIGIDCLKKWLIHEDLEDENICKIFTCAQGDFVSYFLNTIHDEAPITDNTSETPQKKVTTELRQTEAGSKFNRRINLFPTREEKPVALNKSESFPDSFREGVREFSTPKHVKSDSEVHRLNELNLSYMSPISPLYRNNSALTTPKNKTNVTRKSSEKNVLCLGDFIVNTRKSSSGGKKKSQRSLNDSLEGTKKEKIKRINPTVVNHKNRNPNFHKTENSFDFKNCATELPEERGKLIEEGLKVASQQNATGCCQIITPRKFRTVSLDKSEVIPDLNQVTQREKLDLLVSLYVFMLDSGLVLNLCSELHFLISLLLCRQYQSNTMKFCSEIADVSVGIDFLDKTVEPSHILNTTTNCDSQITSIFDSIHNVMYFAVKSLETQLHLLNILDKDTLKLLSSNSNLSSFSNNLKTSLLTFITTKQDHASEKPQDNMSHVNVCFISDTDNRENFPNDHAFNAFRKQRDLFYEILRIWEKNHLQTEWNFSMALGGKIKALLSLNSEPMNFMHLARLFKSQLLSSCGRYSTDDVLVEEQLPFLSSLPNVNMEKLIRLKTRLVTKQPANPLNAKPEFIGHQEFYKEFILAAATHVFIRHVSDAFVSEIVEMNGSKFTSTELEDGENNVDCATRDSFIFCIKSLRILAKFLGFIDSLPYKTTLVLSEQLITSQAGVRQTTHPHLNLLELIKYSVNRGRLVITIPWAVKYLSMLDCVTLRLPYYIELSKMLFDIYTSLSSSNYGTNESCMLIKFSLGWLFDLPHFPDHFYYNFCSSPTNKKMCILNREPNTLDRLHLIDQPILYICCPYLKEIKKLLVSNTSNDTTVKHITPLTAVQSPTRLAKKRLEMQLEESFFNGQPVSVKKTVEFVSERLASTCVKHICSTVVPAFKQTKIDEWKRILEDFKISGCKDSSKDVKLMNSKATEFAATCLNNLKKLCREEVDKILVERLPMTISGLLALDILPQTRDACSVIAKRMCTERIEEWMNSHIIPVIFLKEFETEIHRFVLNTSKRPKEKITFMLPQSGRDISHNPDALSGAHLLELIRKCTWDCLEHSEDVNVASVVNILNKTRQTITERCDVNDCILNSLNTLLVDLALLLVTHNTSIMDDESVLKQFVDIWKLYTGDKTMLFKSVICLRNIMMLAQSSNPARAWNVLAKFLVLLLKENLMECESFEEQAVAIFRREWDQNTLQLLSSCFNTLIKLYTDSGHQSNKFTLLIEFLSECCVSSEDFI